MGDVETTSLARAANDDPRTLFGGGALVALAASPRAEAIACEAARLAAAWGLPLTFLNVGGSPAERDELAALVRKRAPAAELVCVEGRRVEDALCRVAKDSAAGLIILGALEHEAGVTWYVGSIARRVARQAPCSVLLIAHPRVEPIAFQRPQAILHGVERARALLALGLALARREQAHDLHAVVEHELPGLHVAAAADEHGEDGERYRQSVQHQEELALARLVGGFDLGGAVVRRFCVPGRRGFAALDHAREHRRDLLLWRAPARRPGLIDRLFPHDIDVALRDLACPLLLYRPPRGGRKTAAISRDATRG